MEIGETLGSSIDYTKEALVGRWVRWIILIICMVIQTFTLFLIPLMNGYLVRIYAGKDPAPEVDNWLKLFIDGWKLNIIAIVYLIIPLIIGLVIFILSGGSGALALLAMNVTNPSAFLGLLIGTLGVSFLVFLIFAFIFSLFAIIGTARFAREDAIGAAFAFGEIGSRIGKIGWGTYIISLIVIWILVAVVEIILMLIPIIGGIILFLITPFLSVMTTRYYSLLYDAGN